jgi:TRAP-type mannitol/chloroaromatic compound transport system permease small subunit
VGGDKPVGLVVGGVVTAAFVLLPALAVPVYYLFANVYALITGADFASDTANVAVLLIGLVLTIAVLLLAMAGAVGFIGRALSPKNRDV